jgi:CubicO group peptidase (beta-lactamase class C family)
MKRFFFCVVGVIFLTCSISAEQPMPAEIDAYVVASMKEWEVPGLTVTIVKDGKLFAVKGYGVRELGKAEKVDENTMFDIASLAKSFTAAAVATLVDEGKMRWDDPVRRHLPEFELADDYLSHNMTIRDLLSHRTGLHRGDFMWRFTSYDTKEVLRRMRYLEAREPYRAAMSYSNIGYTAAGEAAAATAGMSWAELVRKRLLEPLGMTDTTAGVVHTLAENHARPHAHIAGVQQPIRNKKGMTTLPAGGVNSTARDIAKWMIFHLGDGSWNGKQLISRAAMDEMHSPQVIIATTREMRANRNVRFFGAYGLGWQIMDFRGRPMHWHSGGANGMPTYMAILPEEKMGVAVFLNTWSAPTLHGTIATHVLDTLLNTGAPVEPPFRQPLATSPTAPPTRVTGTRPTLPLETYAGTYEDKLHGAMTLRIENDKLVLSFGGGESAELTHWHYDTFRVAWHDRTFEYFDTHATFMLNAKGQPVRFDMPLGPRDVISATRK